MTTAGDLPRAVTTDQQYLRHHAGQLDELLGAVREQTTLIGRLVDALHPPAGPVPAEDGGPVEVELTEPVAPPATSTRATTVKTQEPAVPAKRASRRSSAAKEK